MAVVLVVGRGCCCCRRHQRLYYFRGEIIGGCALWRRRILLSFENRVRWQIDFGITGEQCFCGGGWQDG